MLSRGANNVALLVQAGDSRRDGWSSRAHDFRELRVTDRQVQPDPVSSDPTESVAKLPERDLKSLLDPRERVDGGLHAQHPRAVQQPLHQGRVDFRPARRPLCETAIEQGDL